MTLQLINIGSVWSSYPNSLVYVKYFLECIVRISSGYLYLIWFILAHVICTCNSCPCYYALVGEIKLIDWLKTPAIRKLHKHTVQSNEEKITIGTKYLVKYKKTTVNKEQNFDKGQIQE